jgi:hypothetical protein
MRKHGNGGDVVRSIECPDASVSHGEQCGGVEDGKVDQPLVDGGDGVDVIGAVQPEAARDGGAFHRDG